MSRIRRKRLIESKSAFLNRDANITLLPKQKEFIFMPERFTAMSGGFGSAKTFAGCMKGIILSALFPGNSGLVARETLPELRDSTRKTFLELLPPSWILSWQESFNILLLKNGSTVIFRPIDDVKKQRSLTLGWFYLDQAEEMEETDFLDLIGRLRHPVPRQFGFLTANPDGHNWIWQRFFNKLKLKSGFNGIDSSTFENPYLPDGYIQSMIDTYPDDMVQKFLYGSHEVRSGVILSEYSDDLIVDPFILPSGWIKGRGMDWGVDKPCTRVSVALSEDGIFYVFDCYGKGGDTPEEHAATILERDRGIAYQLTKMDSTAWIRNATTKEVSKLSIAMQFIKAGIKMSPATRDFTGSLTNLKSLMKQGKVKFFRGQCDELIEEIKSWKWGRPIAGKEKPAVGDDHYIDACFGAGTMVLTDNGNIPIEDIKVGQNVLTRQGYKKVISAGVTNPCAEVRKYLFSNGSCLVATKNHPILTTEGFKQIGVLTHSDIICIIDKKEILCKKKQLCSKELNTDDIPQVKIKAQENTFVPPRGNLENANTYIEQYGNKNTATSLEDMLSTMKMETRQTIGLRISSYRLSRSISNIIAKIIPTIKAKNAKNIFLKSENKPLSGMEAQRGESGIVNTQKRKGYAKLKKNAHGVVKNILQKIKHQNIVPITVSRILDASLGMIENPEYAKIAAKILWQSNISEQYFVPGVARLNSVGIKIKKPVYNLEVADCPEYVANGIVVHNCRYIIFALTGRQSESIGPEKKAEAPVGRTMYIRRDNVSQIRYDPVTGFPRGL